MEIMPFQNEMLKTTMVKKEVKGTATHKEPICSEDLQKKLYSDENAFTQFFKKLFSTFNVVLASRKLEPLHVSKI